MDQQNRLISSANDSNQNLIFGAQQLFIFSNDSGMICSPTYGVKSIRSKKKYLNINLIDLINNKLKGFLTDDFDIDVSDAIDRDLDTELEFLTMMNTLTMDMMDLMQTLVGIKMTAHVPLSLEVQVEAHLLMFSRMNLLSLVIEDSISVLTQDMIIGLYVLMSGNRLSICVNRYNL
ncbi:hypothetical protein Golob_011468 [Gossypium lobatum]|uniref:Uncharacterized protein n=2 Tax=Gossypium lobatum TaxID=34289 RepID=A0A7J8MPK2_9ROSI|nr:hypothetical protein [Gossypium lobatum]